ncbi:hypothetical protein [Streptomyces sp. B21-083]|uniref:hypothetical protein n=1 Tax=Streptomyces sp. B21-083 TaxID=3039410 RepID=UPI002FEEFEF9
MSTPNATRADIIAMLRDGHSNGRIMRELHCDKQRVRRLRAELDLPQYVPVEQTRTIEEKWALFAKSVDDGHTEWTGTRGTSSGTPVLSYKDRLHTAASVAFKIHNGREPEGYVLPDCGMRHCVTPGHVNDEAGRQRDRQRVRTDRGLMDRPATCVRGHDQAERGRLEPDGTAYCEMCKAEDKRAQRNPALASPERRPARSLEQTLRRRSVPVGGGHRRWTGSTWKTTPSVWWQGAPHSAYKVAFRLHHGRDPEGMVTSACEVPLCVAGGCLLDQRMRQANERADAAFAAIFGEAA